MLKRIGTASCGCMAALAAAGLVGHASNGLGRPLAAPDPASAITAPHMAVLPQQARIFRIENQNAQSTAEQASLKPASAEPASGNARLGLSLSLGLLGLASAALIAVARRRFSSRSDRQPAAA